jgi:hypothetical protein
LKLISILINSGLTISAVGDNLIVSPTEYLTDPLRELIRENKAQLLVDVRAAEREAADLFARLVDSIRRCTAVRGDSDANRDGLIAEATNYTPEQQRDLVEHFTEQAAIFTAAARGSV